MVETVNAAEAEERVRAWYRDERNGVSREETGLVASFCVVLVRGEKLLSAIAVASMWRLATNPDRVISTLPTESRYATFERMAYSVFPADFAAEAARLVRNEPKRDRNPTLERIADALECIALATDRDRADLNAMLHEYDFALDVVAENAGRPK
jgi:hypothetical protein